MMERAPRSASVNAYGHQLNPLLDKLQANTITLDECYALWRWIDIVYMTNPHASKEEKAIATDVKIAIAAHILDKKKERRP